MSITLEQLREEIRPVHERLDSLEKEVKSIKADTVQLQVRLQSVEKEVSEVKKDVKTIKTGMGFDNLNKGKSIKMITKEEKKEN